MKSILVLLAACIMCVPANAQDSGFGPSAAQTMDSRVSALELSVLDLQGRMEEVEKIANREYIERVAKEVVAARIEVTSSSGSKNTRTVSFAGMGSFEVPPGGYITSIDGVPVNQPVHTQAYRGTPAAYYTTPQYEYRVVGQPTQTRRVFIRPRVRRQAVVAQPVVGQSFSSGQTCRVVNGVRICN